MNTARFLDDATRRDLQGRGYTVQPLLDAEEIRALSRLHAETTPAVPSDYYVTAFSADVPIKQRIFAGITGIVKDKVQKLAPGYQIVMASFVTKRARSIHGTLGLHQDYSLVNHAEHLGLNVWCPLCDVDDRNGCLRVVAGSQALGHISATPPNPGPYDDLRQELTSRYLKDVPMQAGSAFLFDQRTLHATEENRTDSDRTSVFLNMVPEGVAPLLYLWNREKPGKLEVYEVNTDFLIQLPPNQYLPNAEQLGGRFRGAIDYTCQQLTSAALEARIGPAASR